MSRDSATGSTVCDTGQHADHRALRASPRAPAAGRQRRYRAVDRAVGASRPTTGLRTGTSVHPAAASRHRLEVYDCRRPQARGPPRDRRRLRGHPGAGRLQVTGRPAPPRASRRRRSATTWPCWRTRATSRQPHTSAGRIPTDKGYRLFVDRLSQVKPLSPAERRAMQAFLRGAVDLDDVMRRSVRLLAQLTRQVAVVQYPTLPALTVRHVEVVALDPRRLMLVVITDTGRVEQRLVELRRRRSPTTRRRPARRWSTRALSGRPARRRRPRPSPSCPTSAPTDAAHGVVTAVARAARRPWSSTPRSGCVLAGTANLTRDWPPTSRPRLRRHAGGAGRAGDAAQAAGAALDAWHGDGVASAARTRPRTCATTSVVSTGYGSGSTVLGGLGVVGPTRMDYPGTMAAVRAVARYVGEILAGR